MKIAHEQLLKIINEVVKEALHEVDASKWGSSGPAFAKKRPTGSQAAVVTAAARREKYVSPSQKRAAAAANAAGIQANVAKATANTDQTVNIKPRAKAAQQVNQIKLDKVREKLNSIDPVALEKLYSFLFPNNLNR